MKHPVRPKPDASRTWFKDVHKRNMFHRSLGPALEYNNGNKIWFRNGKLLRCDISQPILMRQF